MIAGLGTFPKVAGMLGCSVLLLAWALLHPTAQQYFLHLLSLTDSPRILETILLRAVKAYLQREGEASLCDLGGF